MEKVMENEITKISRREFLKMSGFVTAAALMGNIDEVFASEEVFGSVPAIDLKSAIEKVPSACWIGKMDCTLNAWKIDGKVIKFEGIVDDPRTAGALCPKGQAQVADLYDPFRVKAPLKRTNAKGVTGTWQQVTWDEALTDIAAKLNELKASDIKKFVFQGGRGKATAWHKDAFNSAFGTKNKQGHGATCSDAGYRSNEVTFGTHSCFEADFKNCDYCLAWGFNVTGSGGPHLCQITWPQQIIEAKKRGMKLVVLDPQIRSASTFADDWVQIKPGMDMAFFLAMASVLVANNYVDEEYLKKYTNAPVLIGPDGSVLTEDDKDQVYDTASQSAKPIDEVSDPPLTGTYTINGVEYKPAFELYKAHIAQYTPTWASGICGVPAVKITEIATEFGSKARIGETITVDGKTLPYRPVAIPYYHVVQSELGTAAARALTHCTMLVGAVDVVGSTRIRNGGQTKPDTANRDKWIGYMHDPSTIKDAPDGPSLDGSKFFPVGSGGYTLAPHALANPTKYGLPHQPEEMTMWIQMANPVMAAPQQSKVISSYSKLKFVVVVDPFLSETADLLANYVLPAATIDKIEGPLGSFTGYESVSMIRFPVVDTMYDSKPDGQIYMDLCEKLGIMAKYVDTLNSKLGLPDELKLDNTKKPTLEDALDRWAKSKGKDLNYFRTSGVLASTFPVEKRYAYLWTPVYGGVKHKFYADVFVAVGKELKKRGITAPYVNDYNGFPTWRTPTMDSSPAQYDLTLITGKKVWHKQQRSAHNVILNLLDPSSFAVMHTSTASSKGITDGDEVWVESHNALTNETAKLKTRASVKEGIMPGVVYIAHHHGQFSHPVSKARDLGAAANILFPSGEGYVDMTGNQSFQVKVKVTKA